MASVCRSTHIQGEGENEKMRLCNGFLLLDKDDVTQQLGYMTMNEFKKAGYSYYQVMKMANNAIPFEGKYILVEDQIGIPDGAKRFHSRHGYDYFITEKKEVYSLNLNTNVVKKLHNCRLNSIRIQHQYFDLRRERDRVFGKEKA